MNKVNGLCVCVFVCMSFTYLDIRSSDLLHTWAVYCRGPEEVHCLHIWTQGTLLINFEQNQQPAWLCAAAGAGLPGSAAQTWSPCMSV